MGWAPRTSIWRSVAADRRARLGIAYVPQGREIFSQLTVEENLRIGFGARRGQKIKEVPEHIFELVPGAQEDAEAARRRPVRRPAAAARDRPRDGARSASC